MNKIISSRRRHGLSSNYRTFMTAVVVGLSAGIAGLPAQSAVPIADVPLFLPQDVPGNLILTPSVEWPTISVAAYKNPDSFGRSDRYTGLFDAQYCYRYNYHNTESERYFEPMAIAKADGSCTDARYWSGKFMNWATTQAIEPFRVALTGGYRVKDNATETWIEKAWHDGQGGTAQFPNFSVSSSADVADYTAASWSGLKMRIQGLGNKIRITRTGDLGGSAVAYNPDNSDHVLHGGEKSDEAKVYELSVRVQACKTGFLSANCVQYGRNYKPEGLIQEYSNRLRYSIFGYLNDSDALRDGAVLRARQKYVGPQQYPPLQDPIINPAQEWDPSTGVLYRNPDPADATSTGHGVADSGVINYINKFGQMPETAGGSRVANHKSHDPVSEMYYAALRYIRKLGNVPEYSKDIDYKKADGFPVITNWEDPLAYACQANVILGIGDVYTHRDKNLPGNTSSQGEPAKPALVSADTAIDVIALTNKVAAKEGISISTGASWTGRDNSAFIAGMAYDAHVRDQRSDLLGMQTVSTYWVDVREKSGNVYLQPRATNQYWLAAKYGGFRVPADYVDDSSPLPDALWWNNGEYTERGDKRPDNFYVASDPDAMIAGLKQAFAKIASEVRLGSGASLATTSSQLEAGTRLFQSRFWSGTWNGDLTAYPLDADTGAVGTPLWSAAAQLDTKPWADRKIYMAGSTSRVDFIATNVTGLTTAVVDYLRGKRSDEAYVAGKMRPRTSVLGDIVHSQAVYVPPAGHTRRSMVYVGANDGMLHGFDANTGEEVFAYVPKAVIQNTAALNAYAQFNVNGYAHKYLMDGEIAVAEVGTKTYLVATTGRGSPGVFALDVTDPDNISVVWDKTGGTSSADVPQLGNALGKPVIAETAAGEWNAVLGNGPNSSDGKAALVMIGLPSGTVKTVDLGGTNNGLSGVTVWRSKAGGAFDTVYAGDLAGKMRKIVLAKNNTTQVELYDAGEPITIAPQVALRPNSSPLETWVFFGTGRYLSTTDVGDSSVNAWYGIKDQNTKVQKTELLQRSITAEGQTTSGSSVRAISEGKQSDLASKKGWYIELKSPVNGAEGERIVAPLIFQGLSLVATTRIPDAENPCGSGSKGWVMAINPFTGARFNGSNSYFDANDDGVIDDGDGLSGNDGVLPNAGIGLDTGAAGVISVSKRIYTSTDTGELISAGTERLTGTIERVSWREVLLQMRSSW